MASPQSSAGGLTAALGFGGAMASPQSSASGAGAGASAAAALAAAAAVRNSRAESSAGQKAADARWDAAVSELNVLATVAPGVASARGGFSTA